MLIYSMNAYLGDKSKAEVSYAFFSVFIGQMCFVFAKLVQICFVFVELVQMYLVFAELVQVC